ncbi:MAG: hypothetical protein AAB518_04170 [Patescibacteria group bacterium]
MVKRLLCVFALAALLIPFGAKGAESEEARLTRMLAAFNRENIIPGVLNVSFVEGTSKSFAEAVLREFGISITTSKVCAAEADPGGVVKPGSCTTVDNWNESIALAQVKVQQGQEKMLAERLYDHPDITWVEPDYVVTMTAGENGGENGDSIPYGENGAPYETGVSDLDGEEAKYERNIPTKALGGIMLAIVLVFLFFRWKRRAA